jgi:nitroreductase
MSSLEEAIGRLEAPPSFLPDPVETDALQAIMGAARIAPSADNVQMWRFVSVRDDARKKALLEAVPESRRGLFGSAPLLVAALGEPWFIKGSRREQPFFMIDVPIALSHMALQAAEIGLHCAIEFEIDEGKVKDAVRAGKDYRAVAIAAIGKPAR